MKGWLLQHLHDAGLMLSGDLDDLMGLVIIVLLMLRLFQWKRAGNAILPAFGIYVLLKVLLP